MRDEETSESEMEASIFRGLPGSGKPSFSKERFFNSQIRIRLDLLKTRHREDRLLDVCLEADQPFVIDNANLAEAERSKFIEAVRLARSQYTTSRSQRPKPRTGPLLRTQCPAIDFPGGHLAHYAGPRVSRKPAGLLR
jgi:hypothetical protein